MNLQIPILILTIAFSTLSQCEPTDWTESSQRLREEMRTILDLPTTKIELDPKIHRTLRDASYTLESLTYASEPNSRVTALLYLPKEREKPVPAILLACGHGGSKSCLYAQYAGQLYANLGFAVLAIDTIGEEEREVTGRMGARGHDLYYLKDENPNFVRTKLKRMVLGKIVWDLLRGVDYLETRPEIDPNRIGLVGYSLGGASGGCLAILDSRVKAAVLCGWVFSERYATYGKYCTRMPYAEFVKVMGMDEMTALLAPHCATLFYCGDSDAVIDPEELGKGVVRDLQTYLPDARKILKEACISVTIESEIVPGADHRPLFLSRKGVEWLQHQLQPEGERRSIPDDNIRFGDWADSQGARIEKLYDTEARERGLLAVDIGAVYRDPKELACFPAKATPGAVYTMNGWVKALVGE